MVEISEKGVYAVLVFITDADFVVDPSFGDVDENHMLNETWAHVLDKAGLELVRGNNSGVQMD